MRCLANWSEVWEAYRESTPIPPLSFRRGFDLTYGPSDDPIGLLHEVFGRRIYGWSWKEKPSGVAMDFGANIAAVVLDWTATAADLQLHAYEPNTAPCATMRGK